MILVALAGGSSCTKKLVNDPVADSLYLGSLPFVINDNSSFSNFYGALQETGWVDTLYGTGPYTVLVSNDDAYLDYGYFSPGDLSYHVGGEARDGVTLSGSVGYDVLKGAVSFRKLPLGMNQALTSLTGHTMFVTRYLDASGDTITTVDGQPVISLDNPATNGLIQVVTQAVPYPDQFPTILQQIQNDSLLTFFAAALQRTHLDTLLKGNGTYTVLAPINRAVQSLTQYLSPAQLGFNPVSLDSILAADPDSLAAFVKNYILPGRFYLNDFMRRLQSVTDTVPLTMMSGLAVKFTMTSTEYQAFRFLRNAPGMGTLLPAFYSPGSLRLNASPAVPTPETVESGATFCFQDCSDLTAGNGVVQTISAILIR